MPSQAKYEKVLRTVQVSNSALRSSFRNRFQVQYICIFRHHQITRQEQSD